MDTEPSIVARLVWAQFLLTTVLIILLMIHLLQSHQQLREILLLNRH